MITIVCRARHSIIRLRNRLIGGRVTSHALDTNGQLIWNRFASMRCVVDCYLSLARLCVSLRIRLRLLARSLEFVRCLLACLLLLAQKIMLVCCGGCGGGLTRSYGMMSLKWCARCRRRSMSM